ncbi:hypothetical protein [Nitrosomonas communis]|uniref:hypothetical protein n=1 Tax=Nitrosomonas communis TaxID=44574 RepID=UPI0015A63F84|nr:hypothetical protein [Nitrosomonas communis]
MAVSLRVGPPHLACSSADTPTSTHSLAQHGFPGFYAPVKLMLIERVMLPLTQGIAGG